VSDKPSYLRDPAAIYRESRRIIEAETDLAAWPEDARPLAVRLIHACGMTDVVDDLEMTPGAVLQGRQALEAGAAVLCDVEMVAHGIIAARLPAANKVICTLNDSRVPAQTERLATTRSAAAADFWQPDLAGAVVAIGNAPTALFRLLELVGAGGPRPALVIGMPVGFVGAEESKRALAQSDLAYITVHGRRGGSALAAAAVNALMGGIG
jgi:precorrin-8X/cobalt-precorrin-8 methylmutase